MSINTVSQSVLAFIPSRNEVLKGASILIPRISRNVNRIAVPALALLAITYVSGAEAGPIMYASCLAGCAAMGIFAPACWPACLPALASPGP